MSRYLVIFDAYGVLRVRVVLAMMLSCAAAAVSGQAITEVGSLSQPTMGHSATLLVDGRVLVVASDGRAELFNPTTSAWKLTGRMLQGSSAHTATRLTNGDVLIVGGHDGAQIAVNRAEIFDPNTENWTAAGSMNSARTNHSATLMADGSVMVVGGADGALDTGIALATVERFSRASNTWSAAVPLPAPRSAHTANVIPSGATIVLGGSTSGGGAGTTDCLRLAAGANAWSSCTPIPTARRTHKATDLGGGRIFVSGGAAGNASGFEPIYDTATDSWSMTTLSASPLATGAAVERNGNSVLVWAGGPSSSSYSAGIPPTPTIGAASRYFLAQNQTVPIFNVVPSLAAHTLTPLLDGRILVVGGFSSYRFQSIGLGGYQVADPSAKSYVIDRADTHRFLALDALTPVSPLVGERYFVAATINGGFPSPSGLISISDGSASCTATLPAAGCTITTVSEGAKQYTLTYGGDAEYLPGSTTASRLSGDRLRIERKGSGAKNGWVHGGVNPHAVSCAIYINPVYDARCDETYVPGSSITLSAHTGIPPASAVFVGWQGACAGSSTTCTLTLPASGSVVVKAFYAAADAPARKLDVDGDGIALAHTDGLLIRRLMSFIHDAALTTGALGNAPLVPTPDLIEEKLQDMLPLLDVDQDGRVDSATDGLIIFRFLLGFRGNALVENALSAHARRTDPAQIASDLQALMP